MSAIKVGAVVLAKRGTVAGKVGTVVQIKVVRGFNAAEVEYPTPVPCVYGTSFLFSVPTISHRVWSRRSSLVPLTPPGEPEALIESAPVRSEVTA